MDKSNLAIDLFRKMANAISEMHAHEIALLKLLNGNKPGFDELKSILVQLDKTLTDKAVWLIERYKKENSAAADALTEECKIIIAETVEQFVKKL